MKKDLVNAYRSKVGMITSPGARTDRERAKGKHIGLFTKYVLKE